MDRVRGALALCLLLVAAMCVRTAAARPPALVRDINTFPIAVSSNPAYLGSMGGYTYLAATDGVHGVELWKTDGTAAGTSMLMDIASGSASSNPTNFIVIGARAYFAATTQAPAQTAIWVTDGTAAGTHLVSSAVLGSGSQAPAVVGALGSKVLMLGSNALWSSDGTDAGTIKLADTSFGYNPHSPNILFASNGKVYFTSFQGNAGQQPWTTDGTPAGTHLVQNWPASDSNSGAGALAQVGNYVYFVGHRSGSGGAVDDGLYRIRLSDDTVEQVEVGTAIQDSLTPNAALVPMGNLVVFIGTTNGIKQVWRSDGTAAGTFPLVNYSYMAGNSYVPPQFTVVGSRGVFINAVGYNATVFATDGTVAGTIDLAIGASPPQVAPPILGAADAFAYIGSSNGGIYRTDGTAAGTKQITVPAGTNFLRDFAAAPGAVYFNLVVGGAIWTVRYDATSDSTVVLERSPIPPSQTVANYTAPLLFAASSTGLYFDVFDTAIGLEPWVSDGTAGGTHLVANIAPETQNGGSNPHAFVAFRNQLYFAANDGINGIELWRSDGTAAGTQRAADVVVGGYDGDQTVLFSGGNSLLFFGSSPGTPPLPSLWRYTPDTGASENILSLGKPYTCTGAITTATVSGITYFPAFGPGSVELWRTDGTAAGTSAVTDVANTGGYSAPCQTVTFGSNLYYADQRSQAQGDYRLWRSDGTPAGTQLVKTVGGGRPPLNAYFLASYAGALYFIGADSSNVMTLWRSDGTSAGTTAVAPLPSTPIAAFLGVVNNRLLFWSYGATVQNSLTVFDVATGSFSNIPNVPIGDTGVISEDGTHLFFSGGVGFGMTGPWVTDGTASGTKLLTDSQGNYPYNTHWMGILHNSAIFTGDDANSAHWYWRTDGTTAGTTAISQVPAGQSVGLTGLAVGNRFFFTVADPTIGAELYAIDDSPPITSTTTQLAANPATAITTDSVTFTVTVVGTAAAVPTGNVSLLDGDAQFGSATLSATGVATYTVPGFAAGTHNITASYGGDTANAASTSAAIQLVVSNPAPPPVVVTPPPDSGSGSGGSSGGSAGGGGGGGGVTSLWELLGLSLVLWRRGRQS